MSGRKLFHFVFWNTEIVLLTPTTQSYTEVITLNDDISSFWEEKIYKTLATNSRPCGLV